MYNKNDEILNIYEDDDFEIKKIKLLNERIGQDIQKTNNINKNNKYNVKRYGLVDSSLLFDDEDICFSKWLNKMDNITKFIYDMPDWLFYEDEEDFEYNENDVVIEENGDFYDLSNLTLDEY